MPEYHGTNLRDIAGMFSGHFNDITSSLHQVSVGHLGIITELTFKIVKQTPVRRTLSIFNFTELANRVKVQTRLHI